MAVYWRLVAPLMLGVALVTSSCAAATTSTPPAGVVATASPMSTPITTPPPLSIGAAYTPKRQVHRLTADIKLSQYNGPVPSLAASDHHTAYLSGFSKGRTPVWVTHGQANHWREVGGGVPRTSVVIECNIVVDAVQPQHVILMTLAQESPGWFPFRLLPRAT